MINSAMCLTAQANSEMRAFFGGRGGGGGLRQNQITTTQLQTRSDGNITNQECLFISNIASLLKLQFITQGVFDGAMPAPH